MQQLLQSGSSANAATTSGYTPLHLAAREGHQDVAVMLLENGASLSSSTKVSPAGDEPRAWWALVSSRFKNFICHRLLGCGVKLTGDLANSKKNNTIIFLKYKSKSSAPKK